jgi:serine/threonine protein kinase
VASGGVQAYARSRLTVTLNGKYVLERRLGGGGMAEVFLARTIGAEGFSRPVAIKRVLDGLSRDPRFAEMFIAEAQLSSRLHHPNLVSVLDFDHDADGRLFLVMELVDGVDLRGLMDAGPLAFSVVIHLTIQILRGLAFAHDLPLNSDGVRGLVHRDISPHNVLLSWEGAVKVSDFGIAKAREATNATASILIKGKPAYMSPEQVNGRPLDGRSDLFAVGVMMFEMLSSCNLFSGGTPEEALGQVLYRDIPPVRQMRPDVPEDLASVVASLLTRDLGHRMPSAEAGIAALVACENCPKAGREELIELLSQRFAGRAPVRARSVSHASHSDPTLVARPTHVLAPPTKTSTSDLGASSRADRRWLWAVLAAFLVVGGAVGVLVAGGGEAKPAASSVPAAAEPRPADLPTSSPPEPAATAPAGVPPAAPAKAAKADQDATAQPAPKPGAPVAPARDRPQAPARRESPSKSGGIREIHL